MKSSTPFLFATGVENSCPTIAGGVRIDQMDRSGHYARWEEDFALVRESGSNALHYGPPYYRVHIAPNTYDWDVCDAQMQRLRELEITVIADLCHFGVPSWLGGFQDPAFPVLFAEYARAFARRYPWIRHFTPVREIFIAASNSALEGWWNECEKSDRAFVRAMRNLCMAHELAVEAILSERPDAIIVQAESIEHFHAARRDAQTRAEHMNGLKHLSVDLTTGHEPAPGMARFLNEHGVTSNDLSFFRERRAVGQRWLGVDYHPASERRIASTGRATVTHSKAMGLGQLATQYYDRYRMPIFHCATNRVSHLAVEWLEQQWADVVAMRASGIPTVGFTWYPLTDQIDWQHVLRGERSEVRPVGMYDLQRKIRPVGVRYREIVAEWRAVLDSGVDLGRGQTRSG
jgi:beta-glucosidase/6-phospho-beta-glucosidase/beta-galactosidase